MTDDPHIAVHHAGIVAQGAVFTPDRVAFFGVSVAVTTGQFAGLIDSADGIVGALVAPVGGDVAVSVNGQPWAFYDQTQDVDGNGFSGNADDYDRWMLGWRVGYVGCDYLGTGFVSGDSFDAYAADFLAGAQP